MNMMEILYLTAFMIMELAKYWIGLSVFLDVDIIRKWLMIPCLIVGYAILFITGATFYKIILILHLLLYITIFFTMEQKTQRIFHIFLMFFMFISLSGFFSILLRQMIEESVGELLFQTLDYLITSAITLILMIIIKINDRGWRKLIAFVQKEIYILIIFIVFGIVFTVGALENAQEAINNTRFDYFVLVIGCISYLSITILASFIIYIKKTNETLAQSIEQEREMKIIQKQHYELLLEKEEDTRRYRHDVNHHFVYLEKLARDNKTEQMIHYIADMRKSLSFINSKSYLTGNDIIDAILDHYLKSLNTGIEVSVEGKCGCKLVINEMDLCTIIANLVQNASEALLLSDNPDRYIKIKMNQGNDYWRFCIMNSSDIKRDVNNNYTLKTSKKSKKNHGFGLRNVKDAVERNGEEIEVKLDDKKFTVEVVLKIDKQMVP